MQLVLVYASFTQLRCFLFVEMTLRFTFFKRETVFRWRVEGMTQQSEEGRTIQGSTCFSNSFQPMLLIPAHTCPSRQKEPMSPSIPEPLLFIWWFKLTLHMAFPTDSIHPSSGLLSMCHMCICFTASKKLVLLLLMFTLPL